MTARQDVKPETARLLLRAEAPGYTERTHTLSRGNPTVADRLARVQHLLGRDREAAQLLAGAVKALPGNAEVRLRAAVVYAAIVMLEPAESTDERGLVCYTVSARA